MEKNQSVQSWSLNSPLHLVKWRPLLFPKFKILCRTWVLAGWQLAGFGFMRQGTLGKGWCWTPESWWNACMDSLNLNADCKCCETGMGIRDWTEGAYLHLSPVSLRASCMFIEPRISAVCKAMTPSSCWDARTAGDRTGHLPEAS